MRKLLVLAAVTLALATGLTPVTSANAASTPYCGIRWGSLAKQEVDHTTAPVTNLRAGRHRCFDRLVVDLDAKALGFSGQAEGYNVRYVPQVTEDGSGRPHGLAGRAFLSVVVNASAHDFTGRPTYAPADSEHAVNVIGFRTFRQVAFLGTFEGYTTIGVGVRARLPFRVFALPGPGSGSRVVIDVAHRW